MCVCVCVCVYEGECVCMRVSVCVCVCVYAHCTGISLLCCCCCRKNHQRQLAVLQQTLEAEVKAKNEQSRQKKLVEAQIDELQAAIDGNQKVYTHVHVYQSATYIVYTSTHIYIYIIM